MSIGYTEIKSECGEATEAWQICVYVCKCN